MTSHKLMFSDINANNQASYIEFIKIQNNKKALFHFRYMYIFLLREWKKKSQH